MAHRAPANKSPRTEADDKVLRTFLILIAIGIRRRRGNRKLPRELPPELWELIWEEHFSDVFMFKRRLMLMFKTHEHPHRELESIECEVLFTPFFREPDHRGGYYCHDRRRIQPGFHSAYQFEFILGDQKFIVPSWDHLFRLENDTLVATHKMELKDDDDGMISYELQKCEPVFPIIMRSGNVKKPITDPRSDIDEWMKWFFANHAFIPQILTEDELQERMALQEFKKRKAEKP